MYAKCNAINCFGQGHDKKLTILGGISPEKILKQDKLVLHHLDMECYVSIILSTDV